MTGHGVPARFEGTTTFGDRLSRNGMIAPNTCIEEWIIFAKICRLRVCSIFQYLLLWQRGVRSQQCRLWEYNT